MSNKITKESEKHVYCENALKLEREARFSYLALGEMLYNIRQELLYEPFWSSWNEYCMEFKDLSQSSIAKLISIYETFVLKYGYKPEELAKAGGWTKLYSVIMYIKNKEDAKKWIHLASTLSRSDLGKYLVEAKTGVKMYECEHSDTFLIRVCEKCGNKERVYETAK